MIIRTLDEIKGTERDVPWGNGQSRRFLLEKDKMGFTFTETSVKAARNLYSSIKIIWKHVIA